MGLNGNLSTGAFPKCNVSKLIPSKNGWAFRASMSLQFPVSELKLPAPILYVGSKTKSFSMRSFARGGIQLGIVYYPDLIFSKV